MLRRFEVIDVVMLFNILHIFPITKMDLVVLFVAVELEVRS